MDILGIGPLELIVILIIILIVMGPKDIVKSSRTVGKILRSVMTHPTFRLVQDTSREIRNLPYRLAREAGVDDLQKDLKSYTDLPSISPFKKGDEEKENEAKDEEPGLGSWENPAKPPAEETKSAAPDPIHTGESGIETKEESPQTEPPGTEQGQSD